LQSAFLDAAIDRLWHRFENNYGSLWMDRWAGLPMDRVKREWANALLGYEPDTVSEILGKAFEVVIKNKFPPTLPEFLEACRNAATRRGTFAALPPPTIDRETARARLRQVCEKAGFPLRGQN